MIQLIWLKKIATVLFICTALIVLFPGQSTCTSVLEYKKRDTEEEHQKVVSRLLQDRKKVEKAIVSTKILLDKSANRPYLPELYIRLAELYIEKSRIVYFIRKNRIKGSDSSLDQLESNSLKNQAIEVYQRILNNFPDYPDRDKVHFFMAHEYRELGQFDNMVAQYRAIIKQYKKSAYVPEAYLLLGDYCINKEDLDMAKRSYESVLDYPESPAAGIARYKLAWCHINKAEYKKAITLFENAVTSISSGKNLDIDTYKRVDIRLESLIDMAFCYTECYKESSPEQAIEYFRRYSWSRQVYMTVLEKLAYRYLLKKKWRHAATIYRELSMLQHDVEKLLEYSRNTFECVQAIGKFDHTDKDIQFIVKALRKQKYSIYIPDEKKKNNLHDYELYARDLVTHLHQKARQGNSVEDFKRASDSYKLYLDFFENSPVYLEMAANYAEALFSSKQFFEAGRQYEELASKIPYNTKEKEDTLYSAVISYYSALKHRDGLSYYKVAYARDGLKTTGKLYASNFPKSSHVADVLFNVAWISYDAGKYDEAIKDFTDFVAAYPSGKPAEAAIHLILDSYHLREDYEGLIQYGKKVLQSSTLKDSKFRNEIAGIVHAAETKTVSSLTLAAMDNWEKGKSDLYNFAQNSNSSNMGEEALYALFVSSKEKGDFDTLLKAGEDLVRQYPSSGKVESTLSVMIDSTLKTARLRLVVDYLESFAERLPGNANTEDFLYQAGWIRRNLGQYDFSNKDYQRLLQLNPKDAGRRDEIVFAMAENFERIGKPEKVIEVLTHNRRSLTQSGKIRADAWVADRYLQNGELGKALQYRNMATSAYSEKISGNDGNLRNIMAEMTYHFVHQKYQEYLSLKLNARIDNTIAAKKAKLLEDLEKGYQSVMNYKSPDWGLVACYRSYEVNKEFSEFLKKSPLPDLTPEEKEQYSALIRQKAEEYNKKADQYLKTCIELAHRWEICDPKLVAFFNTALSSDRMKSDFQCFSGAGSSIEITSMSLKDEKLKSLHDSLIQNPDNKEILAELSEVYIKKGDFRQALLIAQSALNEIKEQKGAITARLYNNLGISHLYIGNDVLAKEAFQKALEIDSESTGAKINLAGFYLYYGHTAKAHKIYDSLPKSDKLEKLEEIIHPRARELYYVQSRISKEKG